MPTDFQVAQYVNQQNTETTQLATLIAQQQALTLQVMNTAELTKYQTINADDITPTDSTPAPDDFVQKIKSAQLIQH
jgi:hypothetical protein